MAEYIDREALLKRANEVSSGSLAVDFILAAILNAPTADVVEVVRCKDCNNSAEVACGVMYCCYFNKNVEEDGFCYEGC